MTVARNHALAAYERGETFLRERFGSAVATWEVAEADGPTSYHKLGSFFVPIEGQRRIIFLRGWGFEGDRQGGWNAFAEIPDASLDDTEAQLKRLYGKSPSPLAGMQAVASLVDAFSVSDVKSWLASACAAKAAALRGAGDGSGAATFAAACAALNNTNVRGA